MNASAPFLARMLSLLLLAGLGAQGQVREAPAPGMVELDSEPRHAEVFSGDSLLGRTPLRLSRTLLGGLTVWYPSRDAWNAQALRPDTTAVSAELGVLLLRFSVRELFGAMPAGRARSLDEGWSIPLTGVMLPAGLSLAAGVAAVMLKQHADGLYDDYLLTGDESLLSQTKKYDIYAGVSLALLQVGLGYFIYRLFDE
jgi:hypothetical protein